MRFFRTSGSVIVANRPHAGHSIIGEFEDLDGIRLATQVPLSRACGCDAGGQRGWRGRSRRFASHRIGKYACAHYGDEHKYRIDPFGRLMRCARRSGAGLDLRSCVFACHLGGVICEDDGAPLVGRAAG